MIYILRTNRTKIIKKKFIRQDDTKTDPYCFFINSKAKTNIY